MQRSNRPFNFLNTLNLEESGKVKLSLILGRVKRGTSHAVLSPYVKGKESEPIFQRWRQILSYCDLPSDSKLRFLESSNFQNRGPRSIAIPWSERRSSVIEYYTPGLFDPIVRSLKRVYIDGSNLRRLRPLTLSNALSFLKNDTNSGLPYLVRKSLVKELSFDNYDTLLDRNDPCVLFTRTQESLKTRNVWGFPLIETLREMRFYRPLLEYQKRVGWRSALIGPDAVNKRVSKLINLSRQEGKYVVSIDFSAYDSTIKTELQKKAFIYIKDLFQKQFHGEIDELAEKFNTIGLVTPDGIKNGSHGVPSGSTFTNEVDSIVQYIIAKNFGISDKYLDIQGDDGIYVTSKPKELFDYFTRYGLKVNIEKSYSSKTFSVYLQNLFSSDLSIKNHIFGIYPTFRALNRIVYPERFVDLKSLGINGKDYFSIRTISILENCKYHPYFNEFVDYVLSLDEFDLDFSNDSLRKYVSYLEQSSGTEDIFDYRFGDNPKGIRGFESYKRIKYKLQRETSL